ncbi:MAG: Hsp70 family protein [Deltaproteobacteria bacterium]|nr:Hsp70 family protein [Deltaproteobacteria bacterium]
MISQYLTYGIDLGTTNSCIARCEGSEVRVFQNNDLMNVTPSAVHVSKSGRMIIGRRAYNATVDDPQNVAREFKRLMGQKDKVIFPALGRIMSAEELSSEILKSLREDVHRQTGEEIQAAVITVPAAFGTLQCEATARAAQLAGLEESPLLQEPIAAAIAYGATPGARDQRWLVFDLGGGTFDAAVISTRNGRLTVLEHRGNNHFGGKDIDRRIVEAFFLPALATEFSLPDSQSEAHQHLLRRLALKAEEAKIDLSTSSQVVISLFAIGDDQNGKRIEAELTLTGKQLEREIEPDLDKCLRLAEEALAGARISGKDLDRILLVGGPTQMPLIREVLGERFGARLDYSLNPMTVVAQGAALYASTIERTTSSRAVMASLGKVAIKLAFEPVSASLQCPVAGRIEQGSPGNVYEVKIDAEGGYWTSGWFPASDGSFEIPATLREGQVTRFRLSVRDQSGRLLEVEPSEFSVRHGLVVSAPPLPHTISIEVVRSDGHSRLDPVFLRSTPLPAKKTVTYRAAQTLRPREPGTSLPIKLWEGEEFADPQANDWVGNMYIHSEWLHRPIPEGSEIQLDIEIDKSRRITAEAFVPYLNEHFSDLYLAAHEERSYLKLAQALPQEIEAHLERLENVESRLAEKDDGHLHEEIRRLRHELEELDIELSSWTGAQNVGDPDRAKRLVEASREIRAQLSKVEQNAVDREKGGLTGEAAATVRAAEEVAEKFGSSLEKKELGMLRRDLERALAKQDERGSRKTIDALGSLRWKILFKYDWFWQEIFESMRQPGKRFINEPEARRWLTDGEQAIRQGDGEGLRKAVRQLWELQPKSEAEADREQALCSGLRK